MNVHRHNCSRFVSLHLTGAKMNIFEKNTDDIFETFRYTLGTTKYSPYLNNEGFTVYFKRYLGKDEINVMLDFRVLIVSFFFGLISYLTTNTVCLSYGHLA